jgi:hypothetical protein
MQTEGSADLFGFAPVAGRAVVAGFDGGKMTSDAGAILLGATDRTICFTDHRAADLIEHKVVAAGVWRGAGLRRSDRPRRTAS